MERSWIMGAVVALLVFVSPRAIAGGETIGEEEARYFAGSDRGHWHLGLSLGTAYPVADETSRKLLLPATLSEQSLEASYGLGGSLSAWSQWSRRYARRSVAHSLDLQYEASVFLVGLKHTTAPWRARPSAMLHRAHVAVIAAAGRADTRLRLVDDYTQAPSRDVGVAAAIGAEVRVPIQPDFWLSLRDLVRAEAADFDAFDTKGLIFLNSTTLGVDYAF